MAGSGLKKNGLRPHTGGMHPRVVGPKGTLAVLIPTAAPYQAGQAEVSKTARYVLSRFAYLHRRDEHFVLESPLGQAEVVLYDWRAMAMVHTLARPCGVQDLIHELPEVGDEAEESVKSIMALLSLLLECQAISVLRPDQRLPTESPALQQWEFHDLLFHTRSRLGRHDKPLGATFRFLGQLDPLPAVKAPPSGDGIQLFTPDIEALKMTDVPFTSVLEGRQSIRTQGAEPLSLKQLGEFLYRSVRVRVLPVKAEGIQGSYERSSRPYPSGGACYELEVYILANSCSGLSSGLYHYCPHTHRLHQLTDRTPELEALLERAYYASEEQAMPQVLIVLAARFQRVAWKYESMAYALILKHVGVLYQTMYLVATAMGLAACAIGSGDSDVFATAADTDYYVESSVGEFMIGSRTDDS